MPNEWLPVESPQMIGILGADTPGTGRLQAVDQHRDLQGRMDIDQQMHMIRLAAKLQERAAPARQNLCKEFSKISPRSASIKGAMALRRYLVTNTMGRRSVTTACDEEWKSCLPMVGSVS